MDVVHRQPAALPVRHATDDGVLAHHTHPETHQNHIHTAKEQRSAPTARTAFQARNANDGSTARNPWFPTAHHTELLISTIPLNTEPPGKAAPLGGDDRDRTGDPLLAKQVLSQLSYAPVRNAKRRRCAARHITTGPIWWAREDLNLRPHAYQACALTN